ncbi:uncharacterized protein PG998_014825 [Apiospora kogelbergensis]|uniref:uncharacterized protein n=1 Tax=Apiospora kogelbergensis TaxID=1337665 RepID=UPI0031315E0E
MPLAGTVSIASFNTDILDRHLIHSYAVSGAQTESGEDETWRYEIWFFCEDRVVYAIHGGPMAGRKNYQAATYQCVRPGELWQINWLEETGTIVSMVFDIRERRISTMIGFSQGHWENPVAAHGDKRNKGDLTRWRKLAEIGHQTDRTVLVEQAELEQDFRGKVRC